MGRTERRLIVARRIRGQLCGKNNWNVFPLAAKYEWRNHYQNHHPKAFRPHRLYSQIEHPRSPPQVHRNSVNPAAGHGRLDGMATAQYCSTNDFRFR